jgi:hypothetical protein
LYYQYIWRTYRTPETITSDRGPQFISSFASELGLVLGFRFKLSTASHPQTDGNTEILNQVIQQRLRPFVNHYQDNWSELLPCMDFAQATLPHESTGLSPFEIENRYKAHTHFDWEARTKEFKSPQERLNRKEAQRVMTRAHAAWEFAKRSLQNAQLSQAKQANRKRREPDFDIGDKVYLLKDKSWKMDRPFTKLDQPRSGPWEVLAKEGHSYRLKLPPQFKMHPVFHTDRLRKASNDPLPGQAFEEDPGQEVDGELEWEVDQILASRIAHSKLQYRAK